jgi:tyrosine-protein phosphatase YwqE
MIDSVNDNIIDVKNQHLKRHRRQPLADIHRHCLSGLDDGPATMTESLNLCWRLAEEGIANVVATAHQPGRFDGRNEAARVREAVCNLNESLRNSNAPLEVIPGGEVRMDERVCQLLDANTILTLADSGRYVLLELPYEVFIDIGPLISELDSIGIQAIIAHPERIAPVAAQPQVVRRCLENNAHIVITASSLLGDFGPKAEKAAWYFLSSGWASLVATDAHEIDGGGPRMKTTFRRISAKLGEDLAHPVCAENPSRVVNGRDIRPVSHYRQKQAER